MDKIQKRGLSIQLEANEWFLTGLDELLSTYQSNVDRASLDNHSELVAHLQSIRTLKQVKQYLLAPSKLQLEGE